MVQSDTTGSVKEEQLDLFGDADTFNNLSKETQVCKICQKEKSVDLFWMVNTKRDRRCKACMSKAKKWRQEQRQKYADKNTGVCHCCGEVPEEVHASKNTANKARMTGLCFDHDHDTLKYRGWLCINCNQGIGKLGDDIEGVKKALAYLERHYGS